MKVGHALFVAARATTSTIEGQVSYKKYVFRSGTGTWADDDNWHGLLAVLRVP
ncbi:hypothetical protein [Streptomyces chryseus]